MKKLHKGNKDDLCPDALYTSGHSTKRNSGWNDAGIKRYNELYDAVIEDREIHDEAFEIYIITHFTSAMQTTEESTNNQDNQQSDTIVPTGMQMRFRGRGTAAKKKARAAAAASTTTATTPAAAAATTTTTMTDATTTTTTAAATVDMMEGTTMTDEATTATTTHDLLENLAQLAQTSSVILAADVPTQTDFV
jgi:hypothetical protein